MKLRHASMAAACLTLAALLAGASACNRPRSRHDWRSPAPPMRCGSDADCGGGSCAFEPGAAEGTCVPPGSAPAQLDPDGGAGPGEGPGPNVQPLPSDIRI